MPKYQVVTKFGADYPVGAIIETDSLHPSLAQHVRPLGATGGEEVEEVASDTTKDKGAKVPAATKGRKAGKATGEPPKQPATTPEQGGDDDNT